SLIVYLEDSLRSLTVSTQSVSLHGGLGPLIATFVEGLDFVLMIMIQTLESADQELFSLLLRITEDRGDMMERIRQDYLAEEGSVDTADRAVLLEVTSVFERVIWMTQRFARLVHAGQRDRLTEVLAESSDEGELQPVRDRSSRTVDLVN